MDRCRSGCVARSAPAPAGTIGGRHELDRKGAERFLQRELDVIVVERAHRRAAEGALEGRHERRIEHLAVREDDVLRGELVAVVKLHAAAERDDVGERIGIVEPLRERRLHAEIVADDPCSELNTSWPTRSRRFVVGKPRIEVVGSGPDADDDRARPVRPPAAGDRSDDSAAMQNANSLNSQHPRAGVERPGQVPRSALFPFCLLHFEFAHVSSASFFSSASRSSACRGVVSSTSISRSRRHDLVVPVVSLRRQALANNASCGDSDGRLLSPRAWGARRATARRARGRRGSRGRAR